MIKKTQFLFCLLVVFLLFGCTSPPSGGITSKNITLTVNNFISNCKAGDAVNGTSTNDVSYTATVIVKYSSNGGSNYNVTWSSNTVSSPARPDKSSFSKVISIPTNKAFQIEVTVDASQCSICTITAGTCPGGTVLVGGIPYYFVEPPIWKGAWTYGSNYAPSTMTLSPLRFVRSVPSVCNCQVKF